MLNDFWIYVYNMGKLLFHKKAWKSSWWMKKGKEKIKQNNNAYEVKIHLLYKKKLKFTFKKK